MSKKTKWKWSQQNNFDIFDDDTYEEYEVIINGKKYSSVEIETFQKFKKKKKYSNE